MRLATACVILLVALATTGLYLRSTTYAHVSDAYQTNINGSTFRLIANEGDLGGYAVLLLSRDWPEDLARSPWRRGLAYIGLRLLYAPEKRQAFILENGHYGYGRTGISAAADACFCSTVGDLSAADAAVLVIHLRQPSRRWAENEDELLDLRNRLLRATFPEQQGSALMDEKLAAPLRYCQNGP